MQNQNDERTLKQVYHSAVSGLYARFRNNYDFIVRKYGDDGIQLIADMSREYGRVIAARGKSQLENTDLPSVARFILRIFDTVTYDSPISHTVEESAEKIVLKVNQCPLHFENPKMCVAHTTMEKTVVEELNPGLTYRIGKSIPAGDAYCEHIIEVNSRQKE
jgi:hypothetical protein